MNKLSLDRQAEIIRVLCEGNSIRSTARITGVAINTVVKLLRDVGAACLEYQDKTMRNLPCKNIQCDEIWLTLPQN
jgi:transposase-like protein